MKAIQILRKNATVRSVAFAFIQQQSAPFGAWLGAYGENDRHDGKVMPPMALKDTETKGFQPLDAPHRKADGGGLYLEIFPNGSKLWRWKFRASGKEKNWRWGYKPSVHAHRQVAIACEARPWPINEAVRATYRGQA